MYLYIQMIQYLSVFRFQAVITTNKKVVFVQFLDSRYSSVMPFAKVVYIS